MDKKMKIDGFTIKEIESYGRWLANTFLKMDVEIKTDKGVKKFLKKK